jgi:hypothetical protein
MKQVVIATVSAGVLAAAALSLAATAAAVPTGGASAADTAMMLMRQGYNVAFNGATAMPLSRCNVIGVHGLTPSDPTEFTTVYLDIACPSSNN